MYTGVVELTETENENENENETYRKKLIELGVPEDLLQPHLSYPTLYSRLQGPMTLPNFPLVCDQEWQLRALSDDLEYFQNLDEDARTLRDNYGGSILHYAAWSGNLEAVLLLLNRWQALLNKENINGRNLLFYAAMVGNINILEAVLKIKPALWKSIDSDGYHFVQCAISRGQVEVLYWAFPQAREEKTLLILLGQGSNKQNIFHTAARHNCFEKIFDWGLKNLSEQKMFELLKQVDENGQSVFQLAARYDHPEFFQRMLKYQDKQKIIDLLAKSKNFDFDLFHTAAAFGEIEILESGLKCSLELLWKKAGESKYCLSHTAAAHGKTEILLWLLEKIPAQMRKVVKGGRNIAHTAAAYGSVDVLDLICDEPRLRDLTDKSDNKGRKVDFIAAKYNRPEVLSWMREKKLPMYTLDNRGYNMTKIAITHSNFIVLDWIKNDRPEELNTDSIRGVVTNQETLNKLITLINPRCFTLPNPDETKWLSKVLIESNLDLVKVPNLLNNDNYAPKIRLALERNRQIHRGILGFLEFTKVFFQTTSLRCFSSEIWLQIFAELLNSRDTPTHSNISYANAVKIYQETIVPTVHQRQLTKALNLTEKEYVRISDKINGSSELDDIKPRDLQLQKGLRFFSVTLRDEKSKPKNIYQGRTCLRDFLEGTVRELAADAEELDFLNKIRTVFG